MSLFGQGFGGFGTGAASTTANATTTPATGNLFGTNTTANAPTTGGLFGQPAGTTGGTGLFGQPQQQQPAAGTTTVASGGGLFGQPAAGAQGTNTGTTTTGLFGQPNAQPAGTTGTGLFGQPAAGATTGTTAGTSIFGQPAQQNAQQPGTTGTTGLFGQPANTNDATGGTGLFGQPAANTAAPGGTGLFGQPATNTTATGGTGLFGQPAAGTTNTTGTTGVGLFGQPAANAGAATTTTGGLFGQPAQTAAGTGGGLFAPKPAGTGLFSTQGTTAPAAGGGLFGGLNQSKPFGGTLTTQPTLGLGQTQQPSAPSAPSQIQQVTEIGMNLLQLQQAVQANGEALAVVNRLGQLITSLASERFQFIFYNMVDPSQVSLYSRPGDISDSMWDKAIKENPDPRCMVPAFAVGMGDLQKRVEAQTKTSEAHKAKLEELRQRLTKLSERHVLSTTLASERLSAQHSLLAQRVLSLIQHLHLLIPATRSTAIRPEEERLRTELDVVEEELSRGSVGKGKLNELWGVVGQLAAVKQQAGMGGGAGGRDGMEWRIVDQQGLEQLTWVLSEQQQGLAHLTKLLKENLRDLAVIFEHTGGAPS